jgi:hypothetical protein
MVMNVHVKEYKLNINNQEYTFALNMLSAIKVEEKYGSFAEVFNGLLNGNKFYQNAFKMLSCSCKEKEWEYQELAEAFSINFGALKKLDEMVQDMYTGFEAFKEPGESNGKNEETSQGMK